MTTQPAHPLIPTSKWATILSHAHARIESYGGIERVLAELQLSPPPIISDTKPSELDTATLDDMTEDEVRKCEELAARVDGIVKSGRVRGVGNMYAVHPRPPPVGGMGMGPAEGRLKGVQMYIEKLGYCHLGTTFHEIRKTASTRNLFRQAQDIIAAGLPIKCLEAVVVAAYLTASNNPVSSTADIDRIPCSFKSRHGADTYRHIVLLVRHGERWGSVGLSRRRELAGKDLGFKSLQEILRDFEAGYRTNGHVLLKTKLGLPFSHDTTSNERVVWKCLTLSHDGSHVLDHERLLERYLRGVRGGFNPFL
ncbi:Vasohibin-domain-containing protein [Fimicolochytrium jonesii]|uniref:Vasohibin-domain-containing protein n=1 Tax=Fimicolochytrium jonesii TaxID=1396493 RepID=UPI0022FDF938|nr:Vasohibin-domain-containing protein [Fimicolochytrium jonesii]KAI8826868.1 Vasohibin-domain-containing protein [Fimicolochytrium jonesii]